MYVKDIRPIKAGLRADIKARRNEITAEERERLDSKITERIRHLWLYRDNKVLFTYVSIPGETGTKQLIEGAVADGKTVVVPRCVKGTRNMDFCVINSYDDLEPGAFGVPEPKVECEIFRDYSDGLCIVPAMAFDPDGFRLGYGKGYYDRFLAEFCGKTAGICYNEFVIPKLPRGKYDKAVDLIVTEKRVISTQWEVSP